MTPSRSIIEILDNTNGVPQQWNGLSRHLIARIYPCDAKGVEVLEVSNVYGPITDANLDLTLNWQSSFENSGPESKLPSIMALIQSGQLGVVANMLQTAGLANEEGSITKRLADTAKEASKSLEGKTGITKLNSRQVFSGMPPIKLTFTMHFRAYSDPESEVGSPYRTLLEWALPKKLAEDGRFEEALRNDGATTEKLLAALFPSEAPTLVGFSYGNERYAPMVIEHIGNPIDGPRDSSGRLIYQAIQLSLSTLTALDKNDVAHIYRSGAL